MRVKLNWMFFINVPIQRFTHNDFNSLNIGYYMYTSMKIDIKVKRSSALSCCAELVVARRLRRRRKCAHSAGGCNRPTWPLQPYRITIFYINSAPPLIVHSHPLQLYRAAQYKATKVQHTVSNFVLFWRVSVGDVIDIFSETTLMHYYTSITDLVYTNRRR